VTVAGYELPATLRYARTGRVLSTVAWLKAFRLAHACSLEKAASEVNRYIEDGILKVEE
jgi:hypothetical protein